MYQILDHGSTFEHRFPVIGTDDFGRPQVVTKYRTECDAAKVVRYLSPEGMKVAPRPCGKCAHCRWVKRQSFANSAAMEAKTSDWCLLVTLTIRPGAERRFDHLDRRLEKRLLQLFQKRVNNNRRRKVQSFLGRDCTGWRFVQCGEYGSKRGRAHYHVLVFGKGDRPVWGDVPNRFAVRAGRRVMPASQMLHIPEWPYGFVHVSQAEGTRAAWYVSKYLGKSEQSWSSQSNRVALGGDFIRDYARRLVSIGASIPTQDWRVRIGDRIVDGAVVGYRGLLTGAKRRYLFESFCEAAGKSFLDLVPLLPVRVRGAVVALELRRRRRAHKAAFGYLPFAFDEDLKLQVVNEYRARLRLPAWATLEGHLVSDWHKPEHGPETPRYQGPERVPGPDRNFPWRQSSSSRLEYVTKAFDDTPAGQAILRAAELERLRRDAEAPALDFDVRKSAVDAYREALIADAFAGVTSAWRQCSCAECLSANEAAAARHRRWRDEVLAAPYVDAEVDAMFLP